MNPVEIDQKLMELEALLEKQAAANFRQAIAAAEAEAEQRRLRAVAQLDIRASHQARGEKVTEATIEAEVDAEIADFTRDRLIAQAKHEAGRDAMFATRARIDAMRTIAAGIREVLR